MTLNFKDIVDPDHLSVIKENFRDKLVRGAESIGPYEKYAVRSKDGGRLWLEVISQWSREDGKPIEFHGIARDITHRKELETAVQEARIKSQFRRGVIRRADLRLLVGTYEI